MRSTSAVSGAAELVVRSLIYSGKPKHRHTGSNVAESTEQEEAALAIVQQDHELSVARDTAAAQYRAKERDLSNEFAQRAIDEDQNDAADYSVSHPSKENKMTFRLEKKRSISSRRLSM